MSIKDRSTKSVDRRAAGQATARSAVYATLSAVLAGDEAGIDAVRLHAVQSLEGEGRDSGAVRRVRAQLSAVLGRRSNAELLRSQRSLLPPVESADLPAYESAYCGSDIFRQAQQMADIAGVYRAHGLTVGGARRERPDHVAVELEFMAFLTAKEADALLHLGPDQVRMCREGQALFLGVDEPSKLSVPVADDAPSGVPLTLSIFASNKAGPLESASRELRLVVQ